MSNLSILQFSHLQISDNNSTFLAHLSHYNIIA